MLEIVMKPDYLNIFNFEDRSGIIADDMWIE